MPPSLFALVSLRRGLLLILPFSMGFAGFMFVIAVALQEGAGRSPVQAGLALVPLAVTFLFTSIAGPRLISRFGTRVVTAGALIQGVGLGLMILAARSSWPDLGLLPLLPGGAIAGVGQALQLPVVFRIVLSEVPPARAGVGSGVMVTTQQASLALGVATLGSLFLALVPGMGMRDALVTTLLVQLAGVALTGVLSLRLPRTID
ncbi:hypothetical protein RKD20_005936 [Streptomyces sp. SLBN-8D4]